MDKHEEHIGRRIRSRRVLLGLQQEELARITGIPQGHISRYERGEFKSIIPTKLVRLAIALRTSTDYLLGKEAATHEEGEREMHSAGAEAVAR